MPPEQKATSIMAVAKVDGITKVDGKDTYQLVAVRLVKGYGGLFFTNGQVTVISICNDQIKDVPHCFSLDLSQSGQKIPEFIQLWIKLPEKGKVEFLYGEAQHDDELKKLGPRAWLIQKGFEGFVVDAEKLSAVKGKTAEEVSKAVLALPVPKKEEKK